MLKRTLCLLIALMLALTLLPACAESADEQQPPVLRLYRLPSGSQDPELVGCGVLFLEQDLILTALPPLSNEDAYIAIGGGVTAVIAGGRTIGDAFQLLRMEEPSSMTPLTLDMLNEGVCLGLNAANEPVRCLPSQAQRSAFGPDLLPAWEITLEDDLLPGAFLTDGFSVGGLVISRHTDGEARCIMLDADTLRTLLEAEQLFIGQETEDRWPWITHQAAITQQGCVLTVDWSELDLSAAAEGDKVWTVLLLPDNSYYECCEQTVADGSCYFSIAPGMTYALWCGVGPEMPDCFAADAVYTLLDTTIGSTYTDHAYQDELCFLGISQVGQEVDAEHMADALDKITSEALHSAEHVWLQAVSTYQVDETLELLGCAVLITPEDYTYVASMGFILDPALQDRDVWAFPLDEIMERYYAINNSFAPGEYVLAYFFGDQPVTWFSFTIE